MNDSELLDLIRTHGQPISPPKLAELAQSKYLETFEAVKRLLKDGKIRRATVQQYGDFYTIAEDYTAPPQAELKL